MSFWEAAPPALLLSTRNSILSGEPLGGADVGAVLPVEADVGLAVDVFLSEPHPVRTDRTALAASNRAIRRRTRMPCEGLTIISFPLGIWTARDGRRWLQISILILFGQRKGLFRFVPSRPRRFAPRPGLRPSGSHRTRCSAWRLRSRHIAPSS